MRIVCVSDLHGCLPPIPEADVLVIAGDICPVHNHKKRFQASWLKDPFLKWLRAVPVKYVVATWGNHDWIGEWPGLVPELPWRLLVDAEFSLDGVNFYGTPWQPEFCDWAFNLSLDELAEVHRMMPVCDVLISHGPPFGVRDTAHRGGEHLGAKSLNRAIERTKPSLVVCGHIHGGYGIDQIVDTLVVNASLMNEQYQPVNPPIVVDLKLESRGWKSRLA